MSYRAGRRMRLQGFAASVILATAAGAHAGSGCAADINGDQEVNVDDILLLLGAWGDCPGCPEDVNGSGTVDVDDLLQLLQEFGQECASIEQTELAGNPLGEYPHFEFVAAFNEGSPIHAAIDPNRHEDLVGVTADLYVVAAKTVAEWETDSALVDVTNDGAQAWTIVAGSITDNIVEITGSASLNGDAGTQLGVAYDIVVDANQNGVLDQGDLIDGYNAIVGGREPIHGMYVVNDLTDPGPLAVTELTYNVPNWTGASGYQQENLFYPTNLSGLENLPLVIVSRGNGHNYQWYDHLGFHLASRGYVVMSHNNHTEPGIETASETTLLHTDTFLGELDAIAGGVLQNKIDRSRILWIGHSRGGEGVVRAYDRLFDGEYVPQNYSIDDIILVSSIAPTDFLGPEVTDPHDVPYHLWTGGADADVNGCADCNICQTFHLHDRAEAFRQSISLHGAGHGDFHNGGGSSVASGPCLIGRANTHQIMRGYIVALFDHYARGNVPARDFLWRQWESFRPIGAPTSGCVSVDLMYREGVESESFVIDDFQTELQTSVSSSGGAVLSNILGLSEGAFDDPSATFTHLQSEPFNGMTLGGLGDDTRGLVLGWTIDRFIEFEVTEGNRERAANEWLSFRACQITRHPNTTAALGDLTFGVALRDGNGVTSLIHIGAYGGGIEEPYQRTGCGSGAGWANEFETIRIRLSDFAHDSDLDLDDIEAVQFVFGPSVGSSVGQIGLDDLRFVNDIGPTVPGSIRIRLNSSIPELVGPGESIPLEFAVSATREDVVPDSVQLLYRFDDGPFQSIDAQLQFGQVYAATLPGSDCGGVPQFFLQADGSLSGTVTLPEQAPDEVFTTTIGVVDASFWDMFETDTGWTTEVLGASSGQWQRGIPVNDPGWDYDPLADGDGSGRCYLTQNQNGNTDVDNGSVRLTSPVFSWPAGQGFALQYDYYLYLTRSELEDRLLVEISDNGGATWTTAEIHDVTGGINWRRHFITEFDLVNLGLEPGDSMRVRYTANDSDEQSIVEAGVDGFRCSRIICN